MEDFDLSSAILSSFIAIWVAALVTWVRSRKPKEKEKKTLQNLNHQLELLTNVEKVLDIKDRSESIHGLADIQLIALRNIQDHINTISKLEIEREKLSRSYDYPKWRLYSLSYPFRGLFELIFIRSQAASSIVMFFLSPLLIPYMLRAQSTNAEVQNVSPGQIALVLLVLTSWYAIALILEKKRCIAK